MRKDGFTLSRTVILFDLHWQDQTDKADGIAPYLITTYGTIERALVDLDRLGVGRREGPSFAFDVPAESPRNVGVATLVGGEARPHSAA